MLGCKHPTWRFTGFLDESGLEQVNMGKKKVFNGSANIGTSVCAPLPINLKAAENIVIKGSLKIWAQRRSHFGLKQAFPSTPFIIYTFSVGHSVAAVFQKRSEQSKGLVQRYNFRCFLLPRCICISFSNSYQLVGGLYSYKSHWTQLFISFAVFSTLLGPSQIEMGWQFWWEDLWCNHPLIWSMQPPYVNPI